MSAAAPSLIVRRRDPGQPTPPPALPVKDGTGGLVFHLRSPKEFGHLRFEWHPKARRVYVIHLSSVPLMGEPIAYDIDTEAGAWNATLIFIRGMKAASIWAPSKQET